MLWSNDLSKKIEFLNYLEPLINIRSRRIRNKLFKSMADRYDELSLILLIIHHIISSINWDTTLQMGLTRTQIIEKLQPDLEEIDNAHGVNLSSEDHQNYLVNLINYLESNDAKLTEVQFMVLSDPLLAKRSMYFRILVTDIREDQLYYEVDEKIINIFRNIANQHDIESKVEAEEYLLKVQIQKGNLNKAIRHTELQIINAEDYMIKISLIISNIRTNYEPDIWQNEQLVSLNQYEDQLHEWVSSYDELISLINTQFGNVSIDHEDYGKIEVLKQNIFKSHQIFLRLFEGVKRARETFIQEHWSQRMYQPQKENYLDFDSQILPSVAILTIGHEPEILSEVWKYYNEVKIPKIHNVSYLLDLLSSGRSKQPEPKLIDAITDLSFSSTVPKFPKDLENQALDDFIEKIKNKDRIPSVFAVLANLKEEGLEYLGILSILYHILLNPRTNCVTFEHSSGSIVLDYNLQILALAELIFDEDKLIEGSDIKLTKEINING